MTSLVFLLKESPSFLPLNRFLRLLTTMAGFYMNKGVFGLKTTPSPGTGKGTFTDLLTGLAREGFLHSGLLHPNILIFILSFIWNPLQLQFLL